MNQITPPSTKTVEVNEQILREIYDNTRKTKSYMKWQLIITVALVALPLIAMMFIIPFALKSLTSIYSTSGLLQ